MTLSELLGDLRSGTALQESPALTGVCFENVGLALPRREFHAKQDAVQEFLG